MAGVYSARARRAGACTPLGAWGTRLFVERAASGLRWVGRLLAASVECVGEPKGAALLILGTAESKVQANAVGGDSVGEAEASMKLRPRREQQETDMA